MTQLSPPISAPAEPAGRLNSDPSPSPRAAPEIGPRSWRQDVLVLSKPGIVKLVLVTTGVGFIMAAAARTPFRPEFLLTALWCLIGTALSAAGANALNQAFEVRRDSAMHRTRHRPMPAGRMSLSHGLAVGIALSALGLAVLAVGANLIAAAVSLATILSYVFIYTPMKPLSPLATIVGAIPGALPPLIGWAAASEGPARGLDHPGGWSIFAIMFIWQIPHFLALAWKYREDYARGGHMVLPVVDPSGARTALTSVVWSIALIPVSLIPVRAMPVPLGWPYAIVASAAGIWFAVRAWRLLSERSDANARALFLGSIVYLPLVLAAMVGDLLLSMLLR